MSSTTDQSKPRFRLSQLLYDTRYRSLTIQAITFGLFLAVVLWLINNTIQNLHNAGSEVDFSFLWQTAGYEINQRLIEYTPEDTHFRAALIGLLNTLLVAVLGCVAATVIGTLVGILRLSKNWLIAQLMTTYVEIFRNVPVLLWIMFIMAILTEMLPPPNAFRGENPIASMLFFDSVAVTNRGTYVPEPLFSNSLGTLNLFGSGSLQMGISLDLMALIAVIALSVFVAGKIAVRAESIQNATGARPRTWHVILGTLVLPTAAVLLLLGLHFDTPELRGFNFRDGIHMRTSMIALAMALGLYTSAFVAEIVRGGILAISRGQTEAAASLGLRPKRIMRLVILPQALRVIIPPVISEYLSLTKNTSLAIAVGYMDITGTLGGITMNQTGRALESILLLMLVYLVISLIISAIMNRYNARLKLVEQ